MTRYFEVKVTGCLDNCMYFGGINRCRHESIDDSHEQKAVFMENKDQLTDSCPMWDKTKESETK